MAVKIIDFGMNVSWFQVKITALGSELKYVRYRNTCSLTDHWYVEQNLFSDYHWEGMISMYKQIFGYASWKAYDPACKAQMNLWCLPFYSQLTSHWYQLYQVLFHWEHHLPWEFVYTAALGRVKVTNSRCEVSKHTDFRVNAPIQKFAI